MGRIALIVGGLALAAVAVWRPAPRPAIETLAPHVAAPAPARLRHGRRSAAPSSALVYVVGAVARPGLYRIGADARADDAIREAGGLAAGADPAGVNLAAHVADGDEIDVPLLGEPRPRATHRARKRTHASKTATVESVNGADAAALALVPGIGATIAARIVALREREGPYDSFDELLDVAGMTPARLDRARPYLRL
jgi:competence protein ComEA